MIGSDLLRLPAGKGTLCLREAPAEYPGLSQVFRAGGPGTLNPELHGASLSLPQRGVRAGRGQHAAAGGSHQRGQRDLRLLGGEQSGPRAGSQLRPREG